MTPRFILVGRRAGGLRPVGHARRVRRWRQSGAPAGRARARGPTRAARPGRRHRRRHRSRLDAARPEDTDASGTLAVGVQGGAGTDLFGAHARHFGEPVDATFGALVTRVSPAGQRLATTVLETPQLSELHGLRATPGGYALVGRVRTERPPDGGGWDAYAAVLSAAGARQHFRVIDVDQSDILFDIVALDSGRYLAAGATAYTQNPSGAGISEQAQPLLLSLGPDLSSAQRVPVAAGPRQNQVRSLAARDRGWLVGGLRNGPGTHSGDGNPALIVADGVLLEPVLP